MAIFEIVIKRRTRILALKEAFASRFGDLGRGFEVAYFSCTRLVLLLSSHHEKSSNDTFFVQKRYWVKRSSFE